MKLIGAGLPRTATTTQKAAFELLGFGPCYHMQDMLKDLETSIPLWERARDGDASWDELFDGCDSLVDWPAGFFYRELIDVYPDAKVVLSIRDGASWERSMRDTIVALHHGDSLMYHLSRARYQIDPLWRRWVDLMWAMAWIGNGAFAGSYADGDQLIAAMHRWNDEVKATVPAERLLVWQPRDGWEPLCDFLGVAVPAEPLPHVNDTAAFKTGISGAALASLQAWWADQAATARS
jgi:hypothetical protein